MPAGEFSDRQPKGLLCPTILPENVGIGIWPSRGKSECCGNLNFFLGGEKGDRWMAGILETNSTNHGLTRFTFWSKSGSSHVTCRKMFQQIREKIRQTKPNLEEELWTDYQGNRSLSWIHKRSALQKLPLSSVNLWSSQICISESSEFSKMPCQYHREKSPKTFNEKLTLPNFLFHFFYVEIDTGKHEL